MNLFERIILLNEIDNVKNFVENALLQDFDIEISSGKYTVNGKSIMGIFSLDLTKPIKLIAHCEGDNPFLTYCDKYTISIK